MHREKPNFHEPIVATGNLLQFAGFHVERHHENQFQRFCMCVVFGKVTTNLADVHEFSDQLGSEGPELAATGPTGPAGLANG